jgi:protein O-mannosyl-transferase
VALSRVGRSGSRSRERADPLKRAVKRKPIGPALLLAAGLAALTLGVYAPVRTFSFLLYDDNVYVTDNARTAAGLTAGNVAWSFTAFESGNWHPLTLLSHMLDVQLFGFDAAGHHGMNLALHLVNVLLLFWLLTEATSQLAPAAFVASVFAIHPLNVQTVAWISERKSLLCTAFWLAALLAHVRYRRQPDRKTYLLVLLFAALALLAKPMAVTLPLTLILIDIWPLATRPEGDGSIVRRYAWELWPFVALAAACGVLTVVAQRAAQALQTVDAYTWPVRIGNGVVSYAWYLKSMIWPVGLAVFYPHPMSTLSAGVIAASAALLLAICAAVVIKRNSFPELAVGWWWYAGTLLPVAGLIQVGSQAYADRYAYVPLIGIFIAIAWSAMRLTEERPAIYRQGVGALGVASIVAMTLVTRAQLPYWHDSLSLFKRAVDVVPDNALAHNNLGMALVERNDIPGALEQFQKAVAIAPWDSDARSNLGNALRGVGRPADAKVEYEKALAQSPDDATIHYNLATALNDLGLNMDAASHLKDAVRLEPDYTKARMLLGSILYNQGRSDDALAEFREVARRHPEDKRAAEAVLRTQALGGH